MKRVSSHKRAILEMKDALQEWSAHEDSLWAKQPTETLMAFNQVAQSIEYTEEHFDANPQPEESVV